MGNYVLQKESKLCFNNTVKVPWNVLGKYDLVGRTPSLAMIVMDEGGRVAGGVVYEG